jgi:hemophore-related protein
VLNSAGGYLNAHPGANDVLTRAATQPADVAENNVRGYFEAHPNEYLDLRNIAQPLINQRNQCGFNVSGSSLNMLFDELAA